MVVEMNHTLAGSEDCCCRLRVKRTAGVWLHSWCSVAWQWRGCHLLVSASVKRSRSSLSVGLSRPVLAQGQCVTHEPGTTGDWGWQPVWWIYRA